MIYFFFFNFCIKIYVCLSDYSIFIALFLHTTFFGYLDKKWKRLARVLSWVFYLISVFISLNIFRDGEPVAVIIGYPILITLISYTLKPFIVKDKS